ncbi:ATP-binding protein [Pararhodobacter zhoushanensis]|uniref:histidine kinase n=1 Tax=Pararhodobacter zhoushanensis TaxID=2479545 RepID=A0ABT3GZL1_9RHOB|nr:ATP-binding protein [Pararhodobacter zhoushanensis]MCW1932996.1 ATP-binding protein [Pararhodobacter zhoushanensis]
MTLNILIPAALGYVVFLFVIASLAERRAESLRASGRKPRFLRSPLIYTLSLSVYCTAWTFYGAVGYAARSGLEFVTIYLGPTLVFVGWWWLLRKLVRIGKAQRVTSIADLISSRYGKSNAVGVIVTILAVVATTPYIALQLQSIALAFGAFAADQPLAPRQLALWVAVGLALFTILFGTRNLDANEQHHGVVTAIAVEAVVKLVALLAVGIWVVWGLADGPADIMARISEAERPEWEIQPGRWLGLTFLAGVAVMTLPRMFQVLVVENADESHVGVASWAFPLYLMAMSLFVLPIAVAGLTFLPPGMNPDLFVLTLPHALGQDALAMLAFLGGFSAATSMVIVAALALATMVSNHIVVPLWLSTRRRAPWPVPEAGDMRGLVLNARRLSIGVILGLGYLYFAVSGGSRALAAIGLISFAGMAQVFPALMGALYWRGASRLGAVAGLVVGALAWLYTLFLPSFGPGVMMSADLMAQGPLGIGWLRPHALFGVEGMDPLLHALFWSLALNAVAFIAGSLLSFPSPVERVQSAQFVNVFDYSRGEDRPSARGWSREAAENEAEDLLAMSQQILGGADAQGFFQAEARAQGKGGFLPDPTPDFLDRLERELAGSVGAATGHAMIAQIVGGRLVTVDDLMAVASETAQIMEHSAQLEAKSEELARTARQLREANEMLQKLSVQKDSFLSQISHELRTPMTSIRAFSEILMDDEVSPDEITRYARIIHDESIRLTRLLDDLLDLSVLEHGQVNLDIQSERLSVLLDRALMASNSVQPQRVFTIRRQTVDEDIALRTDIGRLTQVFINVLSNARKYCDATQPEIRITTRQRGGRVTVEFVDNGSGIPKKSQMLIFEKFARLTDTHQAGGAGLGLAICREIMQNLGGEIAYLPGQGGAAFRVSFPAVLQARPSRAAR